MNAKQLHDVLFDSGIRLVRDGDTLVADVLPGADLTPFLEQIRENTESLLRAADLREQIIAAATANPANFDRTEYDRLWDEWDALNTQQQEDAA